MKEIIKPISTVFLLILLITGSCTVNQGRKQSKIVSFTVKEELAVDFPIKKACWFEMENVFYVWQKNTSFVHIYKDGKHFNTIGRAASERMSLNGLEDICLGADGKLLLLATLPNRIMRINHKGLWQAEILLTDFLEPKLLAASSVEKFYVYDQKENDIAVLSETGKIKFRFGEMFFSAPVDLSANQNVISIHEQDGKTYFFSELGRLLEETQTNAQIVNEELIFLDNNYLVSAAGDEKYALNLESWSSFYFNEPNVLLISSDKIITGEFKYEKP